MKKNILKSIFHFDRFDVEQYQKVINYKNGIEKEKSIEDKLDWQLFLLKIVVLTFLLVLIVLSISTICFIKE
jgi:hypothetical protein